MAGKVRRKRRRRNVSNRREMIAISAVVLILLVLMVTQSNNLRKKNAEYLVRIEGIEKQIDQESERALEIEELEERVKTPEYAGEVAKEKLGLVEEDEIIFKAIN